MVGMLDMLRQKMMFGFFPKTLIQNQKMIYKKKNFITLRLKKRDYKLNYEIKNSFIKAKNQIIWS